MKKSLSHAVARGVVLLALAGIGPAALAAGQAEGVEYQIKWDAGAGRYRVFMRPTATPARDLTISSQITLRMPHTAVAADQFKVTGLVSNHSPGANWTNSSKVLAPIEDPTIDYLSFTATINSPQAFGWQAGVEQEVFNFANSGKCIGPVTIMNNDTDPFNNSAGNSMQTNPGNEFSNLSWTTAENDYIGNYGAAADCRSAVTNTNPTAAADIASVTAGSVGSIDVLVNDGDLDGDLLSISSFTQGTKGGVVSQSGSKLNYTPANGFVGNDTFTYVVSDGKGGTATAMVTVTVSTQTATNTAPLADDDTANLIQGGSVTINVLANDTDVDGDTLTIASVTNGASGTAVIQAGKVVYTPATNFSGTDTFTYTVSDGKGGTKTANVTVTVTAKPNTVPVANNDTASASQGGSVTVDVLANDTDADGDTLTIASVTNGTSGNAVIQAGKVVYTPATNFVGTDTFTYTVADGKGGTKTGSVAVTVANKPNTVPAANNDTANASQGGSVTVDVLANDTDADGDTLTIASVTNGTSGTAVIQAGKVVYTPATNFVGTDTFTYTVSDGKGGTKTANVTVTVTTTTTVNKPPVVVNDTTLVTVTQGGSQVVIVLGNDSDPDGDTLTVTSVTQGAHGTVTISNGQLVYAPTGNYSGPDSFTYTVSDGKGGSATGTVNVNVSTNPPTNTCDQPPANPQPNSLYYRVGWSATDQRYHVYMYPGSTPTPNLSQTAQVTVKVPTSATATSAFGVANLQSAIPDIVWSTTASKPVQAPNEDKTSDYISFLMTPQSYQAINWTAGQEVEVFSFANSGSCLGAMSLLNNTTDPFNMLPNSRGSNPGNQFTNLGWGDSMANNYTANYGCPAVCVDTTNDTDKDGVPDDVETKLGMNPNKADSDGDGVPDGVEVGADNTKPVDTDGDGKINALDTDDDGDGIPTTREDKNADGDTNPASNPTDTDNDGIPNYLDTDDDGDGKLTKTEDANTDGDGDPSTNPTDTDGDGIPNVLDPSDGPAAKDTDGDGLTDAQEATLGTDPSKADSDGDGLSDSEEVGANASSPLDSDGDGKINALDTDDDNDGLLTKFENYNGGTPANDDHDGDGKPDYLDADDDGDGVATLQEMSDPNKDGSPADALDTDKDGLPDYLDKVNGANPPPTGKVAIPTLSEWAQILLSMLMGVVAFRRFGQRRDDL